MKKIYAEIEFNLVVDDSQNLDNILSMVRQTLIDNKIKIKEVGMLSCFTSVPFTEEETF